MGSFLEKLKSNGWWGLLGRRESEAELCEADESTIMALQ